MLRSVKTLLIWLLLTALPMQGIAAAAMQSCRSVEQITATAIVAADDAHPGPVMHAHHHAAQHDGHHHASGKHDASTSCSACASCCIGAAPLPAGLNWTFVHNRSEPVIASPAPFMTGFIPGSLERPPRTISA
jgi:hypothetical protein